jgi:DNA-binding MarR family transcriptional regulator
MSKKDKFIKMVDELLSNVDVSELDKEAVEYFTALKMTSETDKPQFTENGRTILLYMRDNADTYNNCFTAKSLGELLDMTSRTVSGAMRKLVTDGYVEKIGTSPVVYSVTQAGREVE